MDAGIIRKKGSGIANPEIIKGAPAIIKQSIIVALIVLQRKTSQYDPDFSSQISARRTIIFIVGTHVTLLVPPNARGLPAADNDTSLNCQNIEPLM